MPTTSPPADLLVLFVPVTDDVQPDAFLAEAAELAARHGFKILASGEKAKMLNMLIDERDYIKVVMQAIAL